MNKLSLKLSFVVLCAAVIFSLIIGCGGGGGGGGTTGTIGGGTPTVSISTSQTSIAYGQTITITANVSNSTDTTVVFTISPQVVGLTQKDNHTVTFTAPATSTTYTITATPDAPGGQPNSIKIKVIPVAISITPSSVQLAPNGSTQFSASVTGNANTAANFKASGGTVTVINSNSVTYQAPATPGNYTLTAVAAVTPSAIATAAISVSNGSTGGTATINGTVTDDQSADLGGVVVQFYNSAGTLVGQATTASNGTFSAAVSSSAVSFGLSSGSINTLSEFESYTYGGLRYDPLITGCYAPIGTLQTNQVVQLSSIVVASQKNPPPPPPNGCS
ncbi:MAG TPA: hypothetical protein VGL56_19095 [Fimbriimonadaceae bacterium]|jgi:hypothetical protein